MTDVELMLEGINAKRESIISKMKDLNKQWSHDHPGVNVNTTLTYRELVKELLDLDTRSYELKEEL